MPDQFCDGLSSSPSNMPPPHDRYRFPLVTPYDNVIASHRLVTEYFGIERIKLVVGFSMSAQQAFHWAALYPEMVEKIAPLCGSAKTSPHNWLHLEGMKLALQADAEWANGDYETPPKKGFRAFFTVAASWFASQTFYRRGLHLKSGGNEFKDMQDYLDSMLVQFSAMDVNNYLCMLETWQAADVSNHPKFNNDLEKALNSIACPALVMPCKSDLYFPPEDSALAVSMMPNAELKIIPGDSGHLAGLPGLASAEDDEFIDGALIHFLSV